MSINVQLPDEITTEILSRLPVDSVIECKRVCKTWHSLIDEPTFGDTHTRKHLLRLDHSSSSNSDVDDDDAVTNKFFFLLSELQPPAIPRPTDGYVEFHFGKFINVDDDQMGGFIISKALSNIDEDLTKWVIVGSSNGLICLSGRKGVYVYNPFTSEYVNLGHPAGLKTSAANIMKSYDGKGFGYDPCTNEYKVVLVHQNNYWKNEKLRREVSVYVLGSGMWRSREEEEDLPHTHRNILGCTPGVLMNGALHWLRTIDNGNHHYGAIVSFDLADEKFRSNNIVPSVPAAAPSAPDSVAWVDLGLLGGCLYMNRHNQPADLGLLGGCLCMTQHNRLVSKSSDIWVMNNRDKFWTMKFRIPQKKDVEYYNVEYYTPIARLGSKILLLCKKSETIASYDIETGNIDYDIVRNGLKYSNHDFVYNMVAAIPYVKSFISLKALGEEGAKKCKMIYKS